MTNNPSGIAVRILVEDDEGTISDTNQEYDLEDFGILPSVGDLIVDPGVIAGRDRRSPENRKIMRVEKRYFQPESCNKDGTRDLNYVNLVVRIRQAHEAERLVACRR